MRISLSIFLTLLLGGFMLTGIVFGQENGGAGAPDSSLILEGKLLNQLSGPVAGVSVSVEGSLSIPSVSDESGEFSIGVPEHGVWIIFTPPEKYQRKRIYVDRRKDITVYLSDVEDISSEDMIPHPGGNRPLKHSNSPVQIPDIGTMSYFPVQSVDQFLQGVVPGMWVTGSSGMPGSGAFTALRGIKSMHANTQPLYIIDGIPVESHGIFQSRIDGYDFNPLASIDPNDITSIHVHRDNNAGMYYGMRGSNGVVMIETLKPSEVRTIIDFGFRTGIRTIPRQIPQLNGAQYRSLANEILYSSGATEEQFMGDYPGLFHAEGVEDYFRFNHETNWQDEIFRNAIFNDVYFRVRGGDQIARYGLSVGYLKHNGNIINTDMDRLNIRFIGTFRIFEWLRMYVSSNLSNSNNDLRDAATFPKASPVLTALQKSPLLSPYAYDKNGNLRFEGDLGKSLKLNSNIGYNYLNSAEGTFMPDHGMALYYENQNNEIYNFTSSMKNLLSTFYTNTSLNYRNQLGKAGELYLSAGVISEMNRWEEDYGIAMNSNRNDEYRSLQSGTSTLRQKGGLTEQWNRLSFYGSGMYSYKDRYILNAGVNSQFSSRLGKLIPEEDGGTIYLGNEPFGLFFSTGFAWRLSQENFMQDINWLEDFKLRFSWGTSGNDDVGNTAAMQYYSPVLFQRSSGIIPGNMSDNSLSYEKNEQINAGLDLSLFRNRIGLSFELYKINTSDMLIHEPVSSYTGFYYVPQNGCDLVTQGWELQANFRLIRSKDFKWDLLFNLSSSENTITEIIDGAIITPFEGGSYISKEGNSLLNFYGYVYEGVFSSKGEAEQAGLVNESGLPFVAGDAIFSDLKGPGTDPDQTAGGKDGIIDDYDKTLIGSPIPDFFGGLSSKISWRRWSLFTQLSFVYGNEVFNYLRFQNESMSSLANQSTYTLNRWQYDGHETKVPRALWDDPVGNSAFSSRWIEDGSYLRLSNLSLSYHLPDDIKFLKNAEIFVSAGNLFTISGFNGYDPEFSYSFRNLEQGMDYGLNPHTKTYMLGFKLGF